MDTKFVVEFEEERWLQKVVRRRKKKKKRVSEAINFFWQFDFRFDGSKEC